MCRYYKNGQCSYYSCIPTPTCGGDIFSCDFKKSTYFTYEKKEEPKLASKQGSTNGGITMDEALKRIQGGTKMAEQTKCTGSSEWYAKQFRRVGEYLIKNAELLGNGPERDKVEIVVVIDPTDAIHSIRINADYKLY